MDPYIISATGTLIVWVACICLVALGLKKVHIFAKRKLTDEERENGTKWLIVFCAIYILGAFCRAVYALLIADWIGFAWQLVPIVLFGLMMRSQVHYLKREFPHESRAELNERIRTSQADDNDDWNPQPPTSQS